LLFLRMVSQRGGIELYFVDFYTDTYRYLLVQSIT